MDFYQLKYFIQIAKTKNISKAAKILNISQPPLSNSLKNLETHLGVKLIKRNTRNLELTDCGEFLLNRGEYILDLLDSTIREVRDISDGSTGTISIGTVSYALIEIIPNIIHDFSTDYPNIKFKIIDLDSNEIIKHVQNNLLDLGIIRTPFTDVNLDYVSLPNSSYILIGSDLSFLSNSSYAQIVDLDGIPLIINSNTLKLLNPIFKKNNISPNVFCESNDIHTIISLTEKGLGYSIIPEDSLPLSNNNLSYIKINCTELSTGTAIILPPNNYHSNASINFLNYICSNKSVCVASTSKNY